MTGYNAGPLAHFDKPVPLLVKEIIPIIDTVMNISDADIKKSFEKVLGPLVKMLTPEDFARLILILSDKTNHIIYVTALSRQQYGKGFSARGFLTGG